MKPIRRTVAAQQASIARNDTRRSVMDKRSITSSADAIHDTEAASYESKLSGPMDFARDERNAVEYDETQLAAQRLFLTEQFAVMGGYAGTGKTTNVAGILPQWAEQTRTIDWMNFRSAGKEHGDQRRPAIALCTFTNVAAKNLASKLPEEWATHCMSIHSMLAFAPVTYDDEVNMDTGRAKTRFEPRYHSGNRLPLEIICIDEAGIVSKDLWDMIMDAVEPSCRIYFLGDLAQLPALKGVSPMPFAIDRWPTIVLDKIYRQQGDNQIVPNLTRIRKGMLPIHSPNDFRCGAQETLDRNALAARRHIQGYISYLYNNNIWDPKQDIIITPQNETLLGQRYWNSTFRYAFNPDVRDEAGKLTNPVVMIKTALGPIVLRTGDKVMATDNGGRSATEARFNNGSIGTVVSIAPNPNFKGDMAGYGELDVHHADEEDKVSAMIDLFSAVEGAKENAMSLENAEDMFNELNAEEKEETRERQASHIVTVIEQSTGDMFILSRSAEISTLQHAYAATCHKFQGSQARNVMVIVHPSMNFGLNREWLYTSCSRAKKKVFLLAEPGALSTAVTRQQIKGRTAEEKAQKLMELYAKRPWGRPDLPIARSL